MKDLKCGLTNCKYNKGYCCCSKEIEVNQYTDCTTFIMDNSKNSTLFESGTDFTPANYSVDTKVECTAKCIFNKDNRCISNGITVMGQTANEALCLTYIKD